MDRNTEVAADQRDSIASYLPATFLIPLSWLLHEFAHYLMGRALGYPMIRTRNLGGARGVCKFMMRAAFICFLIPFCLSSARAQADSTHTDTAITASNAVYFEFGGPAIFYSINYDRMVSPDFGFRVGISNIPSSSYLETGVLSTLTFPIFLNWFPRALSQWLEFDAGLVIQSGKFILDYPDITAQGSFFSVGIGYHYQPLDGGFLLRIMLTPLFFSNQTFVWCGASFGWAF
jgi:hypothetical protein